MARKAAVKKVTAKGGKAKKALKALAEDISEIEQGATPLEDAVAQVERAAKTVPSGNPESDVNYTDVAIASLCQSYAHTLSLAFHDIVLNQQRRAALGQAALARAIEQVQSAEPKDFEEKLSQLRKGLDVLGVAGTNDMEDFTAMSKQFVDAANELIAVKEKLTAA